jgi:hypothetical protein
MDSDDENLSQSEVSNDKFAELREKALGIYGSIWRSYSTWLLQKNSETIANLKPTTPRIVHPFQFSQPLSQPAGSSAVGTGQVGQSRSQTKFSAFDERGRVTSSYTVRSIEVSIPENLRPANFPPTPSYTSTTPSSRNIDPNRAGGSYDDSVARFVPLADNDIFITSGDLDKYMSTFQSFQWQTEFNDPEGRSIRRSILFTLYSYQLNEDEVVYKEVIQRLLKEGLSADDIDSLDILPSLRMTNESGLLWALQQRLIIR